MAKYTRQELDEKNIFELRDMAKEVGISSPTKCKKAELIELIFKISNGEMAPPVAPRRGRPKKDAPANETTANSDVENKEDKESRQEKGTYSEFKQVRQNNYQNRNNNYNNNYGNTGFKRPDNLHEKKDKDGDEQIREGFLEINPDGYGFLRVKTGEFSDMDAYVSVPKIKQFGLRKGDYVKATCKLVQEGKPPSVVYVTSINGVDASTMGRRPNFDDLVPIYPDQRLRLEVAGKPRDYATRSIDLVAPIGKGQRGLIVSPPKAGKTTLLKMIANSISINHPEVILLVLLIDERPEEVTDMQRSINGEVIYSTFDELPEHHTKTAEMLLERAKRMVETGKDVVILMDSLTRLARAYNLTIPPTGRTLSGGIDPGALHSPKRFFGSARNIENGGSLTIIATALVETGSRMDDVIYEEFKGTGNMEIHLDRRLQEKRIFPAIDLAKSGTRREELLLSTKELEGIWSVRKILSQGDNLEATESLLGALMKTANNKEFIEQIILQITKYQKDGYTVRRPTLPNNGGNL